MNSMKNIFVSSTFRDMQAERDLVQELVVPKLRARAREYGSNVYAIDLRWGVDTTELDSEEGAKKVLSVCFDEIDRSHPYMLIFVGNRYGWVPPEATIQTAIESRAAHFDTTDLHKSITALEIEYGALAEQYANTEDCVVCIRKDDYLSLLDDENRAIYEETDPEAVRRLQALKENLKKAFSSRIIFYSCDWSAEQLKNVNFRVSEELSLEEAITEAFTVIFKADWEEAAALPDYAKTMMLAEAYREDKCKDFYGRANLIDQLYDKIIANEKGVSCVVTGKAGCGKTAILGKVIERLNEEKQCVFYVFAGTGTRTVSMTTIIRDFIEYMKSLLIGRELKNVKEFANVKAYVEYLCGLVCEDRKLFFIVDGVDRIQDKNSTDNLHFIPSERKNLTSIVSYSQEILISEVHKPRFDFVEIPLLSEEEKMDIIGDTYREIKELVVSKKTSKLPLYIKMCKSRLSMMGAKELAAAKGEAEIIRAATNLIENLADDLGLASKQIIQEGIDKIGGNADFLWNVAYFIAAVPTGLRESDLVELTGQKGFAFNSLEFSCFMRYFDFLFQESGDGFYCYAAEAIREAIRSEAGAEYSYLLKKYMKKLPNEDVLFIMEAFNLADLYDDTELGSLVIAAAGAEKINHALVENIRIQALRDSGEFLEKLLPNTKDSDYAAKMNYFASRFLNSFSYQKDECEIVNRIAEKIEASLIMIEMFFSAQNGQLNTGGLDIKVDTSKHEIYKEAREWYISFMNQMSRRMQETNQMELAQMYANKAVNTGIADMKKANESQETAGSEEFLRYMKAVNNKANVSLNQNNTEEALQYYSFVCREIENRLNNGGQMDQDMAMQWIIAVSGMHACFVRLENYERAQGEFEILMDWWNRLKDTGLRMNVISAVAEGFLNAYYAEREQKNYDLARTYIEQYKELQAEIMKYINSSSNGTNLSFGYFMSAKLYEYQENREMAIHEYEAAYDINLGLYKTRKDYLSTGDLHRVAYILYQLYFEANDFAKVVFYLKTVVIAEHDLVAYDKEKADSVKAEEAEEQKQKMTKTLEKVIYHCKQLNGLLRQEKHTEEEIPFLDILMEYYEMLFEYTKDPEIWKLTANYCVHCNNYYDAIQDYEHQVAYAIKRSEYLRRYFEDKMTLQALVDYAQSLSGVHYTFAKLHDYDHQLEYLFKEAKAAAMLAGVDRDYLSNVVDIYKEIAALAVELYNYFAEKGDRENSNKYLAFYQEAKSRLEEICS